MDKDFSPEQRFHMAANTKAALTLSNSIIGVSILAMPFCMKQCGIVLGVLMLSLSSLLTRFTCHLLLKSAQVSRKKTFEFVALHTFGPIGKLAVELNIIGFMLGILISFFVVIGDLGPAIISNALGIENTETLRTMFLILIGLGVALPVSMLRELKSLAQISTLSIVFYTILSLNTATEAFPVILSGPWLQRVHWWRPAGILHSLPIFALALSCQTQILEIYDTLPDPSLKHMNAVVKLAVYVCAALYFMMGFFGYVAHHEKKFSGNILLSSTPGFVTEVMKLFFVLSVALSFPLVVLPCRTSIHSLLFKRAFTPFDVGISYITEARFKAITMAIVIGTLIMGILCPNIELVLEFIGSTIGILICIIAPAVTFIQLTPKSTFEKWGAQFVLGAGILLLAFCTWVSFEPVVFPLENHLHFPETDNEMHPKDYRQEVIRPVLQSTSTTSEKPQQQLLVLKDNDIGLMNLDRLPIDAKIEDIKRQEPPVPQEPEENPNEEFVESHIKVEDKNIAKADAKLLKDDGILRAEKQIENNDAIKKDRENPDQILMKQEELLKKMELQQEEQKKIIIEQREVLKELKAHGIIHQDNRDAIEEKGNKDDGNIKSQNSVTPIKSPVAKLSEVNQKASTGPEGENLKTVSLKMMDNSSTRSFQNISKDKVDKLHISNIMFHKQLNNLTSIHKSVTLPDQPEHLQQRKPDESKREPIIKNDPDGLMIPEVLAQQMKSIEKDNFHSKTNASASASVASKLQNNVQNERAFQPVSKLMQPAVLVNSTVNNAPPTLMKTNINNIADGKNSIKRDVVPSVIQNISSSGKDSLDKAAPSGVSAVDENNNGKRIGRDLKFST